MVVLHQMSDISVISWRGQVTFDKMMMMSALYQTKTLIWIVIMLVHWSNRPTIVQSSQYLFFLLIAVCIAEKQQIPISNPRSNTLERSTPTHYTTDRVTWQWVPYFNSPGNIINQWSEDTCCSRYNECAWQCDEKGEGLKYIQCFNVWHSIIVIFFLESFL